MEELLLVSIHKEYQHNALNKSGRPQNKAIVCHWTWKAIRPVSSRVSRRRALLIPHKRWLNNVILSRAGHPSPFFDCYWERCLSLGHGCNECVSTGKSAKLGAYHITSMPPLTVWSCHSGYSSHRSSSKATGMPVCKQNGVVALGMLSAPNAPNTLPDNHGHP